MTLVMAYVILIAAGISASAVVVEAIVRGRGFATRWVWVGALGLTTAATLFAMIVPNGTPVVDAAVIREPSQPQVAPRISTLDSGAVADLTPLLGRTDMALPVAWLLATSVLLIALGAGQQRYRRERARAKAARVAGHDVLLTEHVGPAVAGVRRPVVFVPRWVLALDENSQQLLVSHELEHVKERDTWLLLYGAVSVALTPWNPVVWWMVRRLRLAVEQDCDARVLARHPGIRRYADLLLTAASRHGLTARLLAAHFGEYTSDLVRRIEAMTMTGRIPWRRVIPMTFAAAVLVAAACEAPRPEPLAPGSFKGEVSPGNAVHFAEVKPATLAEGSRTPVYPEILRQAGVEGEVLVSFVVRETGEVDASSLKVIRSTHDLFAAAVRQALPHMRFTPAESNGRKVSQHVEEPFTFRIVGQETSRGTIRRGVQISGITGQDVEIMVRRNDDDIDLTERPVVRLLSASGQEVAHFRSNGRLDEVRTDDIEAIEVVKPRACPVGAQVECPLITITLKAGREAAYRKR
jgi:TonB family protein